MKLSKLIKDLLKTQENYGHDLDVSIQMGLPNNKPNQDLTIVPDFFIVEEPEGGHDLKMGIKLRAWPY
jgi:hypothetical protein